MPARAGPACGRVRLVASSFIMQGLTITELEKASGVPRSTVYFYVREGMLPTAQKAAASRAIYSEHHLELLEEIARLKQQGLPLSLIKERLSARVASAGDLGVDLVAEQAEQVRQSILDAAARLFARNGYKRTRVADIIKEVGITPPVFYGHFHSKQELFIESYGVFVGWMRSFLEDGLIDEPDPALRDLARIHGYLGMQTLSPDLMGLVRSEALREDGDMRRVVEKSYKDMVRATHEDLTRLREEAGVALPAADELVAFGLLGVVESVVMRASWDGRYSRQDVFWTTLCIFLAIEAAYSGRLDLTGRLAEYAGVVQRLSEQPPPFPPAARWPLVPLHLTIDGRSIEPAAGATILEACLDAGIYIPHLCAHRDLHPAGVCRLCVVEVEGRDGLVTSCTTPAEDGMRVSTGTDLVRRVRKVSAELMLANHPAECTSCPVYLKCELQSLMQYLEFTDARIRKRTNLTPPVGSNPLIVHDMVRCILCGRCVRACSELRGVNALTFVEKNGNLMVGPQGGGSLAQAGCKFCGACVEVCPTGSIRDQLAVFEKYKSKKAALVPCRETCPAGIDIPRYVRFVKAGEEGSATAVVREKVPFPGTLGHVCDHPCEADCRRGEVNEPVAIKKIKRYATEHDDGAWRAKGYRKAPTGKRVAVAGAGPAGLTAAYYLAKSGHQVTVFDRLVRPGGMLCAGLPTYRLPREVLDREIAHIQSVGVQIRCGVEVQSVEALREQGYDAVLVAVGAHQGVKLSIPGRDLPGVMLSTEFLKRVNLAEAPPVGDRVVVLGGGNVAFDCAGVARRLGAREISVACLEPRDAMRAGEEEIAEALEEGTLLYNAYTFDEIIESDGRAAGVRCRRVSSCVFDLDGVPDICIEEGSEVVLPADTVIFAVGQRPDLANGFGVELGRGNRVVVNDATGCITGLPGVFAAGDAVRGTTSVVTAIADGRAAASAIDLYLGGDGVIDEALAPVAPKRTWIGREEGYAALPRCPDEPDEAARCLQCDLRLEITPERFWGEYATGKKQTAGG